MNNYTNLILKLANGKRYFVIRQALYKGVSYFLGAEVTENGEDFTNEFVFLEQIPNEEKMQVKKVSDPTILEVLAKNIKLD